jgi:nitroreductase
VSGVRESHTEKHDEHGIETNSNRSCGALGLDCGPMSGFSNDAVDSEFLANTRVKSNFIHSIGYGSNENLFPRNPRLTFEEAGRFA